MARRRLSLYQKEARKMRAISDLMASLSGLIDGAVRGIRKTSEDPPRVSVLDVISAVTGLDSSNSASYFNRFGEQFPEVSASCNPYKYQGGGNVTLPSPA